MVQDEIEDYPGPKEIFVTNGKIHFAGKILNSDVGEELKLKGKGLYFLKMTPPGKPINPNGTNDSEVLFGEISEHTVTTLNTLINSCFKPLVDRLDGSDWASCGEEQKKEFT